MGILSTTFREIHTDIQVLRSEFSGEFDLHPGLYHYTIQLESGGKRWIHLRVRDGLEAELFIDVTHVVHLSGIAVPILYLALRGMGQDIIRKIILQHYIDFHCGSLNMLIKKVFGVYSALFEPDADCYLCALEPFVDVIPLFSKAVSAPYKVDLALTYVCNNNCDHCYNEPERKSVRSLDLAGWQMVIDKLHDLGVPYLILTGGEPSYHREILRIIKYAADKGMVVGMNSHGRRFSDRLFAENAKSAGLDHLQVTLASYLPEIHNQIVGAKAFEETTTGIQNALAAGIHTITNTTLVKSNQDYVPDLIDFLEDIGVKIFAMNSLINSGKGAAFEDGLSFAEAEKCLTIAKSHAEEKGMRFLWYTPSEYCDFSPITAGVGIKRCNAAEYSICIEPNGDVLPCQSFYQPVGNILTDSWEQIWESELFTNIRTRAGELPEKCNGCPDIDVCSGGCYLDLIPTGGQVTWQC